MLRYELLRSGRLTAYEIAILSIIASYRSACQLHIKDFASMVNCSEKQVRLTLDSLAKKSLIKKNFSKYKKLWIQIAEDQFLINFAKTGSAIDPVLVTDHGGT